MKLKLTLINIVFIYLILSLPAAKAITVGDVTVNTISTAPTLDGVIDSDWEGVSYDLITMNRLSGSGPVSYEMKLYLCHTDTKLYMGFSYNMTTPNSGNWMGLYIEMDNDLNWDNDNNRYDFPLMNGDFIAWDEFHNTTGDYIEPNHGGSDTVNGDGTYTSGTYIFEISQDLNNNEDTTDISLSNGDSTYYRVRANNVSSGGFYQSSVFTMTISSNAVSEIPQQLIIGVIAIPLIAIFYYRKKID